MKIIVELETTPKEIFDLFVESLKYDIEKATGEQPADQELKPGFSYEKIIIGRLGSGSAAKATILRLEEPAVYEMKFENNKGINTVIYYVEKIGENRIKVSYEETYQGHRKMDDLNFKVMSWIFKRSSEKRVRMLLEAMEKHLVDAPSGE